MFLLDTNVVSELRRNRPHRAVVAWMDGIADSALHLSAVTLGELQSGVERIRRSDAAKAAEIETWIERVAETFNILPMGVDAFRLWARLMHGRADELYEDAMIAATARVHGLTVVTRNVRDFAVFGVPTFDPFRPAASR
jgi:predicted nucleic acid-binding protein